MKIIVPMAGMGKRMRPHTLSVPKPLIPIAGVPIVQRLVQEIAKVTTEKIDEIAFIIGDFGKEVEDRLINIAEELGAVGKIFYQKEALGTAHAVFCAKECLDGKVIVAFADTLFSANFHLNDNQEGIIWVQEVADPSAFGVVKVNKDNVITDFIEKPKTPVSNLAIIGIYYFKDGENLKNEIQQLIDNNVVVNGEFQLTDALESMKNKGLKFVPGVVDEWLDCGNKNATVFTNQRILEKLKNEKLVSETATIINSVIIPPSYIGKNVVVENSIIGPYVSVGEKTVVENSVLKNSIIQRNSVIQNLNITNSMVGNFVHISGDISEVSIGDYTNIQF